MPSRSRPLILVVEDNSDTRRFLEAMLGKEFDVISAENAIKGIDLARQQRPDLIVLDIVMPILSGTDACSLLKRDDATKAIPIIFLSSKNTISDITSGLDLGAEDYLAKPFDYKELTARIRARLREKRQQQTEPKTVVIGQLKLVMDSREVFYKQTSIDLTQTEFDILRLLVAHAGQAVSRQMMVETIWKDDPAKGRSRTIDVHIRSLRKKIPDLSRYITSIYGTGYCLQMTEGSF